MKQHLDNYGHHRPRSLEPSRTLFTLHCHYMRNLQLRALPNATSMDVKSTKLLCHCMLQASICTSEEPRAHGVLNAMSMNMHMWDFLFPRFASHLHKNHGALNHRGGQQKNICTHGLLKTSATFKNRASEEIQGQAIAHPNMAWWRRYISL